VAQLTYRTAGESHGPSLISLIEGMPSGVAIDLAFIDGELHRRQGGYGRGARQRIEEDRAIFLSGIRQNATLGSPIAVQIANADSRIDDVEKTPPVFRPRPGHADLAGSIKWLTMDCRATLERASAHGGGSGVAMFVTRIWNRVLWIRPRIFDHDECGRTKRSNACEIARRARCKRGVLPRCGRIRSDRLCNSSSES
jgi:Chorismate synthase